MQKNDELTVKIEDMGSSGEGIAKVDGYPLFIKDAIVGDVAEVKVMKVNASYGFARLMKIVTPSADRVQACCPIARKCGGCQLQEMSYEAQLRFKEAKVLNALERIGKVSREDFEYLPIIGMDEPFCYRNKSQFPVGYRKGTKEIISGFYAGRTHDIMETKKCYLGHPKLDEALDAVKSYMRECHVTPYDEATGKGLVRHILVRVGFKTGQIMVCLIINGRKIPQPERLIAILKKIEGMTSISLNVNTEKTNVILGKETLHIFGDGFITDYIGDIKFQISPQSFYQVNPQQTEKLYGKALQFAGLTGKEVVWDLYCGIGTISLFLAKKAKKVLGVEIVPEAIADAKRNAALNNITNAEFFVGKAEEVVPAYYKKHKAEASKETRPDVICVDPPRKGCDEVLLSTMVEMAPEKIVYVSCDPATLARDVKYLTEHGYRLVKAQAVDQFAQSFHVESVVLLSRK
ncbi:MAG: 23S rRNA (uracil(1939)-C(5))-methyltransferase RlmD [Lachnospiraceae bacterium]|nr:23S rRNA (uracil(1939)-C(5))-methyltransferase RlmD [Lachnospiraceae bacterium]